MPASFIYMKSTYKSAGIGAAKNTPTKVTKTDFMNPVPVIGSSGGSGGPKKTGRATVDKLMKETPAGGRKRKAAGSKKTDTADKLKTEKSKTSTPKDFNTWLKEHSGKDMEKAYNKLRDQVLHRHTRMGKYMDQRSALYRRLEGMIDKGEIPTWKQAQNTATRNRAIAQMLNFLGAKSTTKKGFEDILKKREEKLKDRLGEYGATAEQASEAIENLVFSGLLNRFIDSRLLSSDQILKLWAMAGENSAALDEVIGALDEFEKGNISAKEAQYIISEEYRRLESERLK